MMQGDLVIKWPADKADYIFASNSSIVTKESLERELGLVTEDEPKVH